MCEYYPIPNDNKAKMYHKIDFYQSITAHFFSFQYYDLIAMVDYGCCAIRLILCIPFVFLSFQTRRHQQTVQSEHDLQCLPFCLHLKEVFHYLKATVSNFKIFTAIF